MKRLWILMGLLLAGCSGGPEISSYFHTDNVDISDLENHQNMTTISMILPLSGTWSATGESFQKASLLALDEDVGDIGLYASVRKNLSAVDGKFLLDVQVTVFQGEVLLTGALPSIDLIDKAVEATWKTQGVRRVYNYIRLGKTQDFVDTSSDAAVASAIQTQLMLTKGIKASNYKVVVESGIVYVMGLESSPEEWENAREVMAGTAGVQKIIYLMHEKK